MRVKLLNASTLLRFALKAVLLGGAGALPAMAAELDIRAEFRPDPAQPHLNKFENKTPNSGYCGSYPSQCEPYGQFSLQAPIQFYSSQPITAFHTDPRQGAMFGVPSEWRELTVVHRQTQEQETVKVRVAGLGSRYVTHNPIELVGGGVTGTRAHQLLWTGSSWVNAPTPCRGTGYGLLTVTWYQFFWRTPTTGDGVCAKQARFDIPWLRYEYLDFSYELITPNPLGMSSGEYTGTYHYTVGPGQDFDMGDVMIPSDSMLSLNFTLSVEHDLKVEVPPGGNRIELVPQGGWQAWLNQGRKPARLFRDQTFTISASSRFKMQLECERVMGDTCALRNAAGHQVPLTLSVSLPNGLNRPDGSAVSRQPLLLSGAGTEQFDPRYYVNRRPGTLHFEVAREHTETMLAQGGSTYSGQATVIWDSEL
jgi:hypothetical protein